MISYQILPLSKVVYLKRSYGLGGGVEKTKSEICFLAT